ncbi:MAG TPA: hypothetical protein VIY50_00170 [Steroidobacteraceae bacterium]
MIFEQIATGGCRSYLIGCGETCTAAVIDPEVSQIDRYLALAGQHGLRIRYLIDTKRTRIISPPVANSRTVSMSRS